MKITFIFALALTAFSLAYVSAQQSTKCEMFDAVCALCESYKIENIKEQVKEAVLEEINTGLAECHAEIEQTEQKIFNLLGKCPVRYENKCFWGIFMGPGSTIYQEAADLCRNEGGNLTGVYSNEHLDQLIMYGLPYAATESDTALFMWTGMMYDNNELKQADGSFAPNLKWKPGYPPQDDSSHNILITIELHRANDGIFTSPKGHNVYGCFCEIII